MRRIPFPAASFKVGAPVTATNRFTSRRMRRLGVAGSEPLGGAGALSVDDADVDVGELESGHELPQRGGGVHDGAG